MSENSFGISYNASPLNKFLYAYLLKKRPELISFTQMRAKKIRAQELTNTNTFEYFVQPDMARSFKNKPGLTQSEIGPFDRVIERLGPRPYGSELFNSVFVGLSDEKKKMFFNENRKRHEFANPVEFKSNLIDVVGRIRERILGLNNLDLQQDRTREGVNDLRNYVEEVLGGFLDNQIGEINFAAERNSFFINGIHLSDKVGPERLNHANDRPRVEDLPGEWYGMRVSVENISRGDRAMEKDRYFKTVNSSPVATFGHLSSPINPGQAIRVRGFGTHKVPVEGRVSYFVRSLDKKNKVGSVFGVLPRHLAIGSDGVRSVVAVGNFSEEPDSEIVEREIGVPDFGFNGVSLELQFSRNEYSPLNDVGLIKIDVGEKVENKVNGKKLIGTKTAYDVGIASRQSLYFGNLEVGYVANVFNKTNISVGVGLEPISIEVFTITVKHTALSKLASGTPVHTKDGYLVGFVVGSNKSNTQLYCIESARVNEILGVELLT